MVFTDTPGFHKPSTLLGTRLNVFDSIPYKKVAREKIKLPKRSDKGEYDDQATLKGRRFVMEKY